MRKVFYFLTLVFTVGFLGTNAQTYFPVTAITGTQVVGGITVNVSRSTPPPPFTATQCGTGPYQIGRTFSDWYEYDFPGNITHIRLEMIRIHNDDTIEIEVNNTLYNLTAGNLSPYAGTCTPAFTTTNMITPGGLLGTTGGATGIGQGVTVNIQMTPLTMNNLKVRHIRHATNNLASDVIYNLFVADDSCSLGFVATVDSPTCSGRNVQLDATNFPNTTYAWTTFPATPITPPWTPSANVRNPVLVNANQGHSGNYIVTATRGGCIYRDTITVLITQSPTAGKPIQTGPVCPNEDDTIKVPLVNLPIGGWVVAYGSWGRDTFDATQGYIMEFKDIQVSQANIYYYIYAVDIQGCVSDTETFLMQIKPDVYASFAFNLKEGCDLDTVEFKNLSTTDAGNIFSTWDFDDNSPKSQLDSPTHYYTVPKPNYTDQTYDVELIVTNGFCSDTVVQPVYINHPVKAFFTIDDDSICQGDSIVFAAGDSSYVKPGSIPKMLWKYGDGGTDTIFDNTHIYTLAGKYNATFIMTDFLGCVDSFVREIIVDSLGYVNFATDKVNVCVGEEIVFTGQYSDFGYISAIWDFGDGVTIPDSTLVYHSYNKPGTYDVVFDIKYRICPDTSYTGQYVVKPIPTVHLGNDTAICPNGEPISIGDMANPTTPGITYAWNTPTKDVTPGIKVRHHGTYSVTATLDGCSASDTLVVSKNCYINVPNAFTPNGDGTGDYFLPRQMLSRNVSQFTMQIYNRWGEKVFETNSINGRGWDGKYGGSDQPSGVYIYMIQVAFANGVTERYQGNVTMLR